MSIVLESFNVNCSLKICAVYPSILELGLRAVREDMTIWSCYATNIRAFIPMERPISYEMKFIKRMIITI